MILRRLNRSSWKSTVQFFANRDEGYYGCGIMKLHSKWQQIVEQNGAYFAYGKSDNFNWVK